MRIVILLISMLLLPGAVGAKSLYVNNSGSPACSDSTTYTDNGSANPWCTLGRALWGNADRSTPNASQAATAGDTVIVSAGTYTAPDTGSRFGVAFNPVNEGTSDSSRIIIQASGTVNLRSTGTSGGPVFGSNGRNYITWDGFNIDETTYTSSNSGEQSPVMVSVANYVNILNCTIKGTYVSATDSNHAGIFYHGALTGGRVYNNRIYDIDGSGTNISGIYAYYATGVTIEHNEIYNSGSGIFLKVDNDSFVVRFNKIHDNDYWGIRIGAGGAFSTNHRIYQNLIYNGLTGINMTLPSASGSSGVIIANNTIYNVSQAGIIHYEEGTEVLIHNNIIHTVPTPLGYYGAVGSESYSTCNPNVHDFQHNVYYNVTRMYRSCGVNRDWAYWTETWQQDQVTPQGIYGTDPLFVSVATGDFRLQAGSQARTLGVDILDLDGDGSTTDTIPAGAYVTGNEVIGTNSNLAAPTNFAITPP
jgi:parallel beta-helix repeat protein